MIGFKGCDRQQSSRPIENDVPARVKGSFVLLKILIGNIDALFGQLHGSCSDDLRHRIASFESILLDKRSNKVAADIPFSVHIGLRRHAGAGRRVMGFCHRSTLA